MAAIFSSQVLDGVVTVEVAFIILRTEGMRKPVFRARITSKTRALPVWLSDLDDHRNYGPGVMRLGIENPTYDDRTSVTGGHSHPSKEVPQSQYTSLQWAQLRHMRGKNVVRTSQLYSQQ